MISKENNAYAPSNTSSFSLVNVMESRTECAASLAAASPCTNNFNQISVSGDSLSWENYAPTGLMAIDPSSGNFWALNNADYPILTVYKPLDAAVTSEIKGDTIMAGSPTGGAYIIGIDSSGRVVSIYISTAGYGLRYCDPSSETDILAALSIEPNAIAVDSSDGVWFTHAYNSETLRCRRKSTGSSGRAPGIFKYDPSTDIEAQIANFTHYSGRMNITGLNWLSVGPSGDLWGFIEENSNCNPYNPNNEHVKIFKYDTSSEEVSVNVDITPHCMTLGYLGFYDSGGPVGFTVDSNGIAWVSCNGLIEAAGNSISTLVKYDTSSGSVTSSIYSYEDLGYLASDSNGGLYTIPSGYTAYLYKFDSTTESFVESLSAYTTGSYEWFVCGDTTQSLIPSTDAESLLACSLNGVKWAENYSSAPVMYFFSSTEGESYIKNYILNNSCSSDIYDTVCDVVADLPPYICTKEVKDNIFTYLGVAAANAEILYAALVFLCGIVLDMVKAHSSKKRESNNEKWGDDVETTTSEAKQGYITHGAAALDMNEAIAGALNKYDDEIAALKREVARLRKKRSGAVVGQI